MTLGEKIRKARKEVGMTQEQLASVLQISRQAITKWEADKGIPDVENLKLLSKALDVSIDYLLDDGTALDMTIIKEPINLTEMNGQPKPGYLKKGKLKDEIVRNKYLDAEIHSLVGEKVLSKSERIIDNAIGWLTDSGFGTPEIINAAKNMNKAFYLVEQGEKQFLVTVTDDFLESRLLAKKVVDKKFIIGEFRFRLGTKIL